MTMPHVNLKIAREVFDEVVDLPPADRSRELDRRCGTSGELRQLVDRLLSQYDEGLGDFLEGDAITLPAIDTDDAPAEIPKRIGAYEIVRRIGEGGMGIVYEARQESPRRTVALKVIRPSLASGSILRRFSREASVLGQLQHPGIACIYEAGVADVEMPSGLRLRQPFFAMEYIRGQPLRAFIESRSLSLTERLELAARICDAVQHAHQKGVVHRDLKPGNILVVEDEKTTGTGRSRPDAGTTTTSDGAPALQPKILDFGVARMTDADATLVTQQTDVGQLLGTIPYMSPEQVSGDSSNIDTRSDVYALGVILYELLAGRLPHDVARRSIAEAARVIREEEPSRLSSINAAFRGDVEIIVAKAMEKDRDRRYGTAAEMAADIRRHLRDEPLVARAPSSMYRLRKFARRNRALVAGTFTTFVALVAGLIVALNYASRESEQRKVAETMKQSSDQQRAIAEARLEDVRKLAKAMIFNLHDAVRDLPGSTKARKLIVDTGLAYLDELAAQAADNEAILKDLAGSYKRLAEVQGDPGSSNLGDLKGALETYQKSLEVCRKLDRMSPEKFMYCDGAVAILNAIAGVQIGLGREADAMATYQAARDQVDENARRFPGEASVAWDRAQCDANLGRMLEATGRADEALPLYKAYQEFLKEEFRKDPGNASAAFNIGVVDSRIGALLQNLGRRDESIPYFEDALAVARDCVARLDADVPNPGIQLRLAGALIDLGRTRSATKEYDKAVALMQEAVQIQLEVVNADPDNLRARRGLAVAQEALGSSYLYSGRLEEALKAFEDFRERTESIIQSFPDYAYSRHDLGLAWLDIGKVRFELKQWEQSAAALESAFSIMEAVEKASPSSADAANAQIEITGLLAQSCFNLYEDADRPIESRNVDLDRAKSWATRCLDKVHALKERGIIKTSNARTGDQVAELMKSIESAHAKTVPSPSTPTPPTQPAP